MNRELRQRERHALRRLFAELVGFIKCKFSFWVESFEVRLSSDTDKWDIKGGIHNAGMEKLNFLNTFLFFRLCIKASLNREFSSAQKSFKISRFNNLVLCKSFQGRILWHRRSNEFLLLHQEQLDFVWSNKNKCAVKKPARLNRHGKGWQPQAETPRRCHSIEHTD